MKPRFTLDVDSFQKLLEAAWVIQCQCDFSELPAEAIVRAAPSSKEELPAAVPLILPVNAVQAEKAVAQAPGARAGKLPNAGVFLSPPAPVRIYARANVVGVLALATETYCSPLSSPIPVPKPNVANNPTLPGNETAPVQTTGRQPRALLKLPAVHPDKERDVDSNNENRHTTSPLSVNSFERRSLPAAVYAVPLAALLIMVAFSFLGKGGHPLALTSRTPSAQIVGKRVDTGDQPPATTGNDPSPLPPSHLQVTDPVTFSVLENLSHYEMPTLQRQAQYGDDVAALTLGMAYETGRYVRQSCTQAAKWVAVAAAEGNPAAQYNLALRYSYGDGVPIDLDEARKWSAEAASRRRPSKQG